MKKSAKNEVRFAVCIKDDQPWFELRKVYRVLPDETAARMNHIRVVDEFKEDYLYPENNFVFIHLPKEAQRCILDTTAPRRNPKPGSRHVTSETRRKTIRSSRAS